MKTVGSYPKTRLRRLRKSKWLRNLVSENNISSNDLILPIFIREGKNKIEQIKSMPGVNRYSVDKLYTILNEVRKFKIPMVALFPYTPNNKKDDKGSEALNPNNLICRGLKVIKTKFPDIGVMCDVALDPYTSHGHDGIMKKNKIDNDETIKILVKQALLQAEMGCDIIAPSDMMDGRVGAIRKALDKKKFYDVSILSYAIKYASNFYGPFRDAVGSKSKLKTNKKTYQMDYRNKLESFREVGLDIKEGADLVMIKPGMFYLDIISNIKKNFNVPVIVYQVSGEYSLLKNAIRKKILSEDAMIESITSFKRSGASAIVSYFALEIAKKIKQIN
jgi:porphobilinogen synthase